MIRKLIQWFARKEIDAAVLQERLFSSYAAVADRQAAYLRGHTEGAEQALDALEKIVLARTGGRMEAATSEDINRAKKERVH